MMLPPPPTVVDADVLLRNVDFAWRKGHPGALIALADGRYSMTSGVGLFAAVEVRAEVERHLVDFARHRKAPQDSFWRVWEEQVGSKVRFVAVDPDALADPRIEGTDPQDRPTARLAALLAPCVIATDNRRHLKPFELGSTKTDHVALDLRQIGGVTLATQGALIPPRLLIAGIGELAKGLDARIGRGPGAAVILLIVATLGLIASSERAGPLRRRLAETSREAWPLVAHQLLRASEAGERVEAFAIQSGSDSSSPMATVARYLATRQPLATTNQIAELLTEAGFSFSGKCHRTATRAWLLACPCFEEVGCGRWALGCHSIDDER